MKNNFVSKNDFNRASVHRDLKNDYDRQSSKQEALDIVEESLYLTKEEIIEIYKDSLVDSAKDIANQEYQRVQSCGL